MEFEVPDFNSPDEIVEYVSELYIKYATKRSYVSVKGRGMEDLKVCLAAYFLPLSSID